MKAFSAGKDWRLAVGYRIEPLSGTWAGESMVEIGERYDLDLFDSELADQFELGFFHEADDMVEDEGYPGCNACQESERYDDHIHSGG